MAFFLLINSVGYTIYAHYCDDELQDTSLMVKAESCCEEETSSDIPTNDEPKSCCAEKDVHIVLKDQFVKSELSFSALTLPVLFINSPALLQFNASILPFTAYHSPVNAADCSPPQDLNILHSIFRI